MQVKIALALDDFAQQARDRALEEAAQRVIERELRSDGLLRGCHHPDGVGKGPSFLSAGEMTARTIRALKSKEPTNVKAALVAATAVSLSGEDQA